MFQGLDLGKKIAIQGITHGLIVRSQIAEDGRNRAGVQIGWLGDG